MTADISVNRGVVIGGLITVYSPDKNPSTGYKKQLFPTL